MLKIYRDKQISAFWQSFWEKIPRDPDEITALNTYPIFPLCKYVKPHNIILEAGCGMGRILKHYHNKGYKVIGLEYNLYALQKLKKENKRFNLVCADISHLPFKEMIFDVYAAFGVYPNLENGTEQAFFEAKRVSKIGGIFVASMCCLNISRIIETALLYSYYFIKIIILKGTKLYFYVWCSGKKEWEYLIKKHGYSILESTYGTTRQSIWQYAPFLRKKAIFNGTNARDGDKGYQLNYTGERLFTFLNKYFPSWIAMVSVCVAKYEK